MSTDFLSVKNLKNLLSLINEFFTEKYCIDLISYDDKVNIKVIVYKQMQNIEQLMATATLKAKNKQVFKVSRDAILQSITEYRNVHEKQMMTPQFNMMTSMKPQSQSQSQDVMQQFDRLTTERNSEFNTIQLDTPNFTEENIDCAPSADEFSANVKKIMQERDSMMNSIQFKNTNDNMPIQNLPMYTEEPCDTPPPVPIPPKLTKSLILSSTSRDWFYDTLMKVPLSLNNVMRIVVTHILVPEMEILHPFYMIKIDELCGNLMLHDGSEMFDRVEIGKRITLANGRQYQELLCNHNGINFMSPSSLQHFTLSLHTPTKSLVSIFSEKVCIEKFDVKDDTTLVIHFECESDFKVGDTILMRLHSSDEDKFHLIETLSSSEGYVIKKANKKAKQKIACSVEIETPHFSLDDMKDVSGYVLNQTLQATCFVNYV